LSQDITISVILGLTTGLFVGAAASIAGFIASTSELSPWIAAVLIVGGSTWVLNRQMIFRLNRVYFDHHLTSVIHHLTIGFIIALSSTVGYIYSLSAVVGMVGALTTSAPISTALYMTLCGPLLILELVFLTFNISPIVPWIVVGGWLVLRALLHHPSLPHLAVAQEEQQRWQREP